MLYRRVGSWKWNGGVGSERGVENRIGVLDWKAGCWKENGDVGSDSRVLEREWGVVWKGNGGVGSKSGVLEREWGCWIGGWGLGMGMLDRRVGFGNGDVSRLGNIS